MDIVIILIVALFGFIGYKIGFVKTAINMFSFVVAVGLALLFYKPLAVILTEQTSIDDWVIEKVVDYKYKNEEVKQIEVESSEEIEEDTIIDSLSKQLPKTILEGVDIEKTKRDIKLEIAQKVSEAIMKVLSLVIIFLVVKVTLFIASIVLNGIMQIPVLKQLNETLGLVFGLIMGVAELYIAFAIITFVASITDLSFVVDPIKSSLIASFMFDNNIILKLLF
jgi:uncharacterized membrane protein required for colicin V production